MPIFSRRIFTFRPFRGKPLFGFFLFYLSGAILFFVSPVQAEEKTVQLEPVTVTGSHIPGASTLGSISVIDREEIEKAPADSISDLLDLQGGIELHRRGGGEIQGDLSIRGSTSEQVLILLDGVPLNDPQTSHHDLDLPIFLNEVERIEILKGPGSSLYGTDALGGVVQIISRPPPHKFTARGKIRAGSFSRDLYYYDRGGLAQVTLPLGKGGIRISAGADTSSGFRAGTGYQVIKTSAETNPEILGKKSDIQVSYMDKEFGARDFYTPTPAWEHTKTLFAKTSSNLISGDYFTLKPALSFRSHADHFVLFRDNPERYQNHHLNYTILSTLQSLIRLQTAGELALLLEGSGDWLESSRLGDHSQSHGSLGIEYSSPRRFSWELNSSVRADFHSNQATTISPSLGIGYRPMEKIRLRASSGLSYRSPSFTELYYSDPSNQSDPNLKSERSLSVETGGEYYPAPRASLSLVLLRRSDWNLIDWVRTSSANPWQALNLDDITTYGIEASATAGIFPGLNVRGEYGFLTQERKETGFQYKYSNDFPSHRLTLACWGKPLKMFSYYLALDSPVIDLTQGKKNEDFRQVLINAALSYTAEMITLSLEGKNLTNSRYQDITGVPRPRRYLDASLEFKWE